MRATVVPVAIQIAACLAILGTVTTVNAESCTVDPIANLDQGQPQGTCSVRGLSESACRNVPGVRHFKPDKGSGFTECFFDPQQRGPSGGGQPSTSASQLCEQAIKTFQRGIAQKCGSGFLECDSGIKDIRAYCPAANRSNVVPWAEGQLAKVRQALRDEGAREEAERNRKRAEQERQQKDAKWNACLIAQAKARPNPSVVFQSSIEEVERLLLEAIRRDVIPLCQDIPELMVNVNKDIARITESLEKRKRESEVPQPNEQPSLATEKTRKQQQNASCMAQNFSQTTWCSSKGESMSPQNNCIDGPIHTGSENFSFNLNLACSAEYYMAAIATYDDQGACTREVIVLSPKTSNAGHVTSSTLPSVPRPYVLDAIVAVRQTGTRTTAGEVLGLLEKGLGCTVA